MKGVKILLFSYPVFTYKEISGKDLNDEIVLQTQVMTIDDDKINYKGALANFEGLNYKLSGTYINCSKDLPTIKAEVRTNVQ